MSAPSPLIRTHWEQVDGRRVRLWMVAPRQRPCGRPWPDPAVHLPVLLIHGLGCSVEAWGPLLRHIAAGENGDGRDRPVWAMDMPGYGKSPGPPPWRALGIEELADWTVRLMDRLGIVRAHLAGNSMGCQVALALARRHPERAGALVLCGPTEGADIIPLWRTMGGLLADAFVEPPSYNLTLAKMYLQMGATRYFVTVAKMNADDPVLHAPEVQAPCLLVRGGRDLIVPDRAARTLAARLPNASYVVLDSFAHAVQFSAPEPLSRVAFPFWERSDTG